MRHTKYRLRAFTLIELLAVIAVMLLLLSILTPALQKARDRAMVAVCASNVRQVNTGIIHFCGDNDGHLPSPNWGGGDGQPSLGWLSAVNNWPNLDPLATGLVWPYTGSFNVYRCPSFPVPPFGVQSLYCPFEPYDTRMVTSYNMNGSACDYGQGNILGPFDAVLHVWPTYRIGQFSPMDIMYWEGDETSQTKGWWWDGANFPWEGISARHFGAGTVAHLDGHVERLLSADFYAMANATTNNILRNSPLRPNNGVSN